MLCGFRFWLGLFRDLDVSASYCFPVKILLGGILDLQKKIKILNFELEKFETVVRTRAENGTKVVKGVLVIE